MPPVLTLTGLDPDVPMEKPALFLHVLPRMRWRSLQSGSRHSRRQPKTLRTFVIRVEVRRVMVRQTGTTARNSAILLPPRPSDMSPIVAVSEAMDVQISRRARSAVRGRVGSRR